MQARTKIVKVKDLTFWTENFGNHSDPTCLLICGAGAPAKFWTDAFCSAIANRGYFVIRYDHRDQGLSSTVDYKRHPYTVRDLANDSLGILDGYEVTKAHVIGHSMGGMIAQLLAIFFPQRILSMTSMCVSVVDKGISPPKHIMDVLLQNIPSQNFEADLPNFMRSWKVLNGEAMIDEEIAKAYTRDFYVRSKLPVGVAWNHIHSQESLGDITDELTKIGVPSLFIAGENDLMMPSKRVEENAKLVPGSQFVLIPKMGHMFFNKEIERALTECILDFFFKYFDR